MKTKKQAAKKAAPRAKAKARPRAKVKAKVKAKAKAKPKAKPASSKWMRFVEKQGVVLASARGPVPNLAEAVAGEPIIGSWWAHKRGQQIFDVLCEIDDSDDIRCFKLIDGRITFVHRRVWPALVAVARAGLVSEAQVAAIQQEHMPTGEHRNLVMPFPEWVPDDVAAAAKKLSLDDAKQQLGGSI